MSKDKPIGRESEQERDQRQKLERARYGDDAMLQQHDPGAREKDEPTEQMTTSPGIALFLGVVCCALFAWGGVYMAMNAAGFDPMAYDPDKSAAGADAAAQVFDPMKAGERFYRKNCAVCHQADGGGAPGQYPPLKNSDWVQKAPDEILARILLHGLEGPITVNGNAYNNKMTAFNSKKDRDLAAVLTYVRAGEAFGNGGAPFPEAAITATRAETEGRTASYTVEELGWTPDMADAAPAEEGSEQGAAPQPEPQGE